jgi:potassium-transporting ATPase KdpC subunit
MLLKQLRTSISAIVFMTIITGVLYPLVITGLAQLVFPGKANGSMIERDGRVLGSALIGQQFYNPKYFWSRLSTTSPYAYNASASTGSNYGPLNPALQDAVNKRVLDLRKMDSLNTQPIPIDLVTASASGLDPHISISAASYQAARVARTRGLSEQQVRAILNQYTEGRIFGILGEPRVNVLQLNLALDDFQNPLGGK